MRQLGFAVPIDELVRARDHGVTVEFVREMAALGYTNLTLDNLIRIRDHGVTPDYAKALKALGYDRLAVEDLVMLRDHGLTAERSGPRTNAPAPGCRSICSSRSACADAALRRMNALEAGMRWHLLVDELAEDLRNGFRQIAWNPGFTAIAVLTLALGIGANTALFSIFNSLILRPLPVRDPGRLALLTDGSWSYPIWNEIAIRETELFDGTFAWSPRGSTCRPAVRRNR